MAEQKEQAFRLLPEWKIQQAGQSLIISGGADARYEVDLETPAPSFFATLPSDRPFVRRALDGRDERVLEQLITAEIIVPVLKTSPVLKVAIMGDREGVVLPASKNLVVVGARQPYDCALIVRVNATYAALLEGLDYPSITKPHLLVDLAFHHTASIGPLVFPGETACIACLQGRVATRWGDETPPQLPKVADDYSALVWELVATELSRISRGDTSLTNKTIAWNFQDRAVRENQLLKVPLCPICTQNTIDHSGALALPWRNNESTANTVR